MRVGADAVIAVTVIAGAGVLAFIAWRKLQGLSVSGAVTATDQAISDVVIGAGGLFGIPATNQDQCTVDLGNGDMWAASFSCPASRFIGGFFIDRQNPQLPAITSGGGGTFTGTGASGTW